MQFLVIVLLNTAPFLLESCTRSSNIVLITVGKTSDGSWFKNVELKGNKLICSCR